MKKILVIAAILLAGCATRPESIHADYVSPQKYTNLSCSELSTAMCNAKTQLAVSSAAQDHSANVDAATVFLFLIPASKLGGDHEDQVAQAKGNVDAINTEEIIKKCSTVSVCQ